MARLLASSRASIRWMLKPRMRAPLPGFADADIANVLSGTVQPSFSFCSLPCVDRFAVFNATMSSAAGRHHSLLEACHLGSLLVARCSGQFQ
jgi:hypothetical protein